MSTYKLSNIPVKKLRLFLIKEGFRQSKINRGKGGHEKWVKDGLKRPEIYQSHIDPVPEFIMKQILRHIEIDKKTFFIKMKEYKIL